MEEPNPKYGMPTYHLAKFCQKMHENEKNWTKSGACGMLLCRSATAVVNSDCEQFNCMNSIDFTFKYIPVCPLYSLNVNIYILCWIHSIVYRVSILSQSLSQTLTESGTVKIQVSKTS